MRWGFDTTVSPVPDTYLLRISLREYQRRSFEKTHMEYLTYKLRLLQELNDTSISKGLLSMDERANLRFLYRFRAISTVSKEISLLTSKGGLA